MRLEKVEYDSMLHSITSYVFSKCIHHKAYHTGFINRRDRGHLFLPTPLEAWVGMVVKEPSESSPGDWSLSRAQVHASKLNKAGKLYVKCTS